MSFPFTAMLDGRRATAADLAPLAFAGFAHFTAMQVRGGTVRGLDLHFRRLHDASERLFGAAHDNAGIRCLLRAALDNSAADLSLTATAFSRRGEFTPVGAPDDPALLIRTAPAFDGPTGPLRLLPVSHSRIMPGIKHVGESTKTLFLRQAVAQGFDDAAYVDMEGRLSEATIWNMVFWDGKSVIWPKADMLDGVTQQIIARQLDRMGIAQRRQIVRPDVSQLAGAAVMNSWTPGVAVTAIGYARLPVSPDLMVRLHDAYAAEPAVAI